MALADVLQHKREKRRRRVWTGFLESREEWREHEYDCLNTIEDEMDYK